MQGEVARIKSEDPESSTTEKGVGGVPTVMIPVYSLRTERAKIWEPSTLAAGDTKALGRRALTILVGPAFASQRMSLAFQRH